MSIDNNLAIRLRYCGGNRQIDRMNEDKLRTLKKALLYSYQAQTAILEDGREFRCLINPDKIKNQYDNKMISIPFADICLGKMIEKINEETGEVERVEERELLQGTTTQGIQSIGMKMGDVFEWKENNSYWLVYLQRLEETAYFRAEIRRCRYELNINDHIYKVYAAMPSVNEIDWRNLARANWNDIDYKVDMYITKNEETEAFLHRFTLITLDNKTWEVQSVDSMSSEGIIIASLKEYYENTPQKEYLEQKNGKVDEELESSIIGNKEIEPYSTNIYKIDTDVEGIWTIDNQKCEIISQNKNQVELFINTGRSGKFTLKYTTDENEYTFDGIIKSI